MCNRAVEYVAAAAWRVVLYVGDEVANDKGMDETGQGSLHEACCVIMATIANCVLNSINKVGGIRLHEAEARVISYSTSSKFLRKDPQQVSRLQDNCFKVVKGRINNFVKSELVI